MKSKHNFKQNYFVLCKCGCGTQFLKFDKYGRERRFVFHHRKHVIPRKKNLEQNCLILCKCGCGIQFLKYDKCGRERRFVNGGHAKRIDSFLLSFNKHVIKCEGCWDWNGPIEPCGYPVVISRQRKMYANRFSFELYNTVTLKTEQFVCHKCDNPICTNPDHFFLGTHLDNMHDAIDKGRINARKLSDKDVIEMRRLHEVCNMNANQIAKIFNRNPSFVRDIIIYEKRKGVLFCHFSTIFAKNATK